MGVWGVEDSGCGESTLDIVPPVGGASDLDCRGDIGRGSRNSLRGSSWHVNGGAIGGGGGIGDGEQDSPSFEPTTLFLFRLSLSPCTSSIYPLRRSHIRLIALATSTSHTGWRRARTRMSVGG
jgi:hypothetical protein